MRLYFLLFITAVCFLFLPIKAKMVKKQKLKYLRFRLSDLNHELHEGYHTPTQSGNISVFLYISTLFFFYKNVVFPAQAEYSYFSADFGLKIFLYYS